MQSQEAKPPRDAHSRLMIASAIALTALILPILAYACRHHVSSRSAAVLPPLSTVSPLSHATTTETCGTHHDDSPLASDSEATYQTGANAFIDRTPLQSLVHNISPFQELGEFPSLAEVTMLPEARYAVNLLPPLSHHNRHHVKTWHLYCDGTQRHCL